MASRWEIGKSLRSRMVFVIFLKTVMFTMVGLGPPSPPHTVMLFFIMVWVACLTPSPPPSNRYRYVDDVQILYFSRQILFPLLGHRHCRPAAPSAHPPPAVHHGCRALPHTKYTPSNINYLIRGRHYPQHIYSTVPFSRMQVFSCPGTQSLPRSKFQSSQ